MKPPRVKLFGALLILLVARSCNSATNKPPEEFPSSTSHDAVTGSNYEKASEEAGKVAEPNSTEEEGATVESNSTQAQMLSRAAAHLVEEMKLEMKKEHDKPPMSHAAHRRIPMQMHKQFMDKHANYPVHPNTKQNQDAKSTEAYRRAYELNLMIHDNVDPEAPSTPNDPEPKAPTTSNNPSDAPTRRRRRRSVDMNSNAEGRLYDDLFFKSGYIVDNRPVKDHHKAVDLEMNIAYVTLVGLSDRDQVMTSNIWIRLFWKNEFLTWNPPDYENVTAITVSRFAVWKPDIVLYNSADSNALKTLMDQYKTNIIIDHTGLNTWYIPAILVSSCGINIQYFPFDYQRCELKFGSWSHVGKELDLKVRGGIMDMDMSFYEESSDFILHSTSAVRNVVKYSCCPDEFLDITYSIVLLRNPFFFTFNVIIPTVILTVIASLTFAFPEETGEKIGLTVNCLLSVCILMMMVADLTPVDSQVSPLLATYMSACLIQMSASMTCNALSLGMMQNVSTPVPVWLHDLAFDCIAPWVIGKSFFKSLKARQLCNPSIFCVSMYQAAINIKNQELEQDEEEAEEEHAFKFGKLEEEKDEEDDKKSLDSDGASSASGYPLSSVFSSEYGDYQQSIMSSTKGIPAETPPMTYKEAIEAEMYRSGLHLYPNFMDGKLQNARDIKNIEFLAQKALDETEEINGFEFWRVVAQCFDKVMFCTFGILLMLSTGGIFISIPTHTEFSHVDHGGA